ncbi:MAG TPA: hypothetical protein VM432_06010 [Bdellovibrionales bacterium]|jgi:hypothetical protein|nr:hypothetical protein [Bdellovibrionales bacterium]
MRDYILSFLLLTVLLGGYTAIVLNFHADGAWRNQASIKQDREPGSAQPTND